MVCTRQSVQPCHSRITSRDLTDRLNFFSGKAKQRLLMLTDGINGESEEKETPNPALPEDVLVVSLGIINDCPGMLSENKVTPQKWRN